MFAKVKDGLGWYFARVIAVVTLLVRVSGNRVFVMGDSHTLIFQGRAGVLSRHLGPITLNRFGRDGEAKELYNSAFSWPRRLRWIPFPMPKASDTLVLSFGEIDIRVHVDRISREQRMEPSKVIHGLVDSATRGLFQLREVTGACLVFLGPPPPVNKFIDEKFPSGGSFQERVKWMNELKFGLANQISEINDGGMFFVDIAQQYETIDGELNQKFSDGTVHYKKEIGAQFLVEILNL
jgi:hypothetical protein